MMNGGGHACASDCGAPACGLLERYQQLYLRKADNEGPELGQFRRRVQHAICEEGRCLGSVGTYIAGVDGDDPLLWSRECAEIFGTSEAPGLRTQAYFDKLHRDDLERVRSARRQAASRGGSYDIRFRIVNGSGELRWVHERGAAVKLTEADAPALVGVLQDITEQQLSELNLRASLGRAEDQLRHAQKMESVGRLASGVAHDFNNLLSVVLAAAELALDGLDRGESPREDLEEILRAGQRGAELTRQLLAFARRGVARARVVDLRALLLAMRGMLERVLGEDVLLDISVEALAPRVYADPGMLEQVIVNLAVNARDAMPYGGTLAIKIREGVGRCKATGLVGNQVCIEVTDSGVGMDEATRARIFEPFFTTKEAGHGTGLGLSTVLGIVEQCGGSISVESALGKGTSFKMLLPLVEAEPEIEAVASVAARPTGKETILLVEDEERVRSVACQVLRQSGYTVLDAADGRQALGLLARERRPIQLLVTDVVMPHMGGRELAQRVRTQRPDIKVLFMSGHEDDSGKALAGGPTLSKPFSAQSLSREVRALLDAGRKPSAHVGY